MRDQNTNLDDLRSEHYLTKYGVFGPPLDENGAQSPSYN